MDLWSVVVELMVVVVVECWSVVSETCRRLPTLCLV